MLPSSTSENIRFSRCSSLQAKCFFHEPLCNSDARLFCKKKHVNLKNKPKIGNFTEKQAQNTLAGKFNKTKNQQENQIKQQGGKTRKQAQNEQIFTKTRPICFQQ